MVLPEPEDQGDKDHVKKDKYQIFYIKFPLGKVGHQFFDVWVSMG